MKFIKEDDDERPSGHFANTYNIVVVPAGATAEEAAKAFEDINNYGIYATNMRSSKVTQADIDAYFGPSHRPTKMKMEKERGEPFPIRTKQAMDDFIKARAGKPNLVKFEIQGKTLVFPADKNPTKDATVKIIKTVLDSAGIAYRLQEKETFTEAKLKAIIKEEIRKQLKK